MVTFRLKALFCREADIKERPRFKAISLQRGLLTGHGPIGDAELVAVQHRLAAELLQLLIAAVMRQAASGGQSRGEVRGFPGGWALGNQREDHRWKPERTPPASSPA